MGPNTSQRAPGSGVLEAMCATSQQAATHVGPPRETEKGNRAW